MSFYYENFASIQFTFLFIPPSLFNVCFNAMLLCRIVLLLSVTLIIIVVYINQQ